jgi:hypothetical protein
MNKTPEQQIEELRRQGGVDVTQMPVGTTILLETTMAVYEMRVTLPMLAALEIVGTDQIFNAGKGVHEVRLLHSAYDMAGKITIPHWIGKGLRMFLQNGGGVVVTSAVASARVTSPDKTWAYELWENTA